MIRISARNNFNMTSSCRCFAILLLFFTATACKHAHSRHSVILAHAARFSDTSAFVVRIDSIKTAADSFADEKSTVTAGLYDFFTGDVLYYLYNRTSYRLDVYSLATKKYLKSILLRKNDAVSVGDLQAIFCHTADSIFLLDEANIALIDSTGAVQKRWPINQRGMKTQPFFEKYAFYTIPPAIFHYDSATQSIFVQAYDRSEFSPQHGFRNKESFGSARFIAQFGLAAKRPELLTVGYPVRYSDSYYGNMVQPSVAFLHSGSEGIVYIFPVSSAVFTQNINSDSANKYNCPSSLSSNVIKPLSWTDINDEDLKVRHFHQNANFFRLVHTDSPNFYYRFNYDKMDSADNDFQNVYQRKNLVLTVLNDHFNICKELSMPVRNIRPIIAFSANGTVYIPMGDPLKRKRNFLQFLTIKTEKK